MSNMLSTLGGQRLSLKARDPKKAGIELKVDVPDVRVTIRSVILQQILFNHILNMHHVMRNNGDRLQTNGRLHRCVRYRAGQPTEDQR